MTAVLFLKESFLLLCAYLKEGERGHPIRTLMSPLHYGPGEEMSPRDTWEITAQLTAPLTAQLTAPPEVMRGGLFWLKGQIDVVHYKRPISAE